MKEYCEKGSIKEKMIFNGNTYEMVAQTEWGRGFSKPVKHGSYTISDLKTGFVVETGKFIRGKRSGCRRIYKSSKTCERYVYAVINYRAGKRSGASYGYYPNKDLRYVLSYSGGKPSGTMTAFSDTKALKACIITSKSNKTTTILTYSKSTSKMDSRVEKGLRSYNEIIKALELYFEDVYYERKR